MQDDPDRQPDDAPPGGSEPAPDRAPDRGDAVTIAAIFAIALGLRLAYLEQAWALPFFEEPIVDARAYDAWGRRIAAGDWLGTGTFYQAPAYPYFLGLVYRVLGDDPWVLRVVQSTLGAASCALAYATTQRLFGRAAAWAAGLVLALYAPAIFFDGLIQKTSLGLFLTSALCLALVGFVESPRPGRAAACGALLGVLALTRENALVFAAVVPGWLAWQLSAEPRRARVAWLAAFGAGLALVLLPVGVRNAVVGDSFAVTTSQMGPNFYIGNGPTATGLYQPLVVGRHTPVEEGPDAARLAEREMGRPLSRGEVSRFYLRKSFEWIAGDPLAWLRLTFAKALLTLNDYEVPDTEDLYVNVEFSPLLAALAEVARFGVLLPLAFAGGVFAFRERRARARATGRDAAPLLAAMAVAFAVAVAAFYVWARYRFPLVPLLVPFAGLGVARAAAHLRAAAWRPLVAPVAAALVAGVVSNLSLVDRSAFLGTAWTNLGIIMLDAKRLDEAEAYLARAAALDPDGADVQYQLGVLRYRQERWADAAAHLRRAAPEDVRVHRLLADVLARLGRDDASARHRALARELDPERPDASRNAPAEPR